jgi:two-component system probable response regulator PhcQ
MQPQILYVDDEPKALTYFRMLLEEQFAVATAGSVDEAIAYLAEHGDRVGVVVTDQRMPGKTGVQLMEYLRHHYPSIVRVLTTAYSDLEAAVRSVNEGGAFRYITKPWVTEEMTGSLRRALDYHQVMRERDRLLSEKLTVLHRLIVMDRVRGLATAVTALQGQFHGAWAALSDYMEQSPVKQRVALQMEEIAQINLVAVARREAETMVKTVQSLLADTVAIAQGPEQVSLAVLDNFAGSHRDDLAEEDIELLVSSAEGEIRTDRALLLRLLELLVRRVADMHEEKMQLTIAAKPADDGVEIAIKSDRAAWSDAQYASLFSAAMPLQRWPLGLDMDALAAFLIVHHLGGGLTIERAPPKGPGFIVWLPHTPASPATAEVDADWFDKVYDSLEAWEQAMLE